MKKLPKKLFIQIDNDGSNEYINAEEDAAKLEDGQIGIYELIETKKKTTHVTLD